MLVRQPQCIQLVGGPLAGLVGLDHLPSAPRIAAHGRQGHGVVGRQHACIDQRTQQRNGPRGIAAGVGHAVGLADGLGLARTQLGKTVHPARLHPVGRGGVDDAGPRSRQGVDQRHRFARGIVMQAQDHHVHRGHERLLGLGVLAQGGVDADQFHFRHMGEPFADLEPGGARLSVDENSESIHDLLLCGLCRCRLRHGAPPVSEGPPRTVAVRLSGQGAIIGVKVQAGGCGAVICGLHAVSPAHP